MNALYAKAREKFLNGSLNWSGDTIKVVLVDNANYAVDLNNHEFLSAVPTVARIATTPALTGKTATAGVADADDTSFGAVTGPSAEAIIIYKDTGVAATSPLIFYGDTGINIPVNPNGGTLGVTWDSGSNRIFAL